MGTTAVVLGGGYAGVMAANRLAAAQRPGLEVRLVTPEQRFVERIRLHEYAAGHRKDATVSYSSLLHPDVRLVHGIADRINDGGRSVALAGGGELSTDYLVYAVGSGRAPVPAGAFTVNSLAAAGAARRALAALPNGSGVAVVGGGLTAVETAAEAARSHPRLEVSLYPASPLLPGLPDATRRSVQHRLARAGVGVHEGTRVPFDAVAGAVFGAGVVLWCAGFGVPDLAERSGLPVDAAGRLQVDPALRVPGYERIYGAGDAAVRADAAYARMSCAAALPMGAGAAGNILRSLAGAGPARHDSGFAAQCISLGRTDGLIQFVSAADSPRPFRIHGPAAAVLKESICRMTLRWIRSEARRSGAYTWPRGPRETAPATAAAA